METAVMATSKRKTQTEPTPKAVSRTNDRITALTIKGSLDWRAWVDRGAKHCRTDVAKLVDAALIEYLKARGFDEQAPAR
jgi:hypothetical protein